MPKISLVNSVFIMVSLNRIFNDNSPFMDRQLFYFSNQEYYLYFLHSKFNTTKQNLSTFLYKRKNKLNSKMSQRHEILPVVNVVTGGQFFEGGDSLRLKVVQIVNFQLDLQFIAHFGGLVFAFVAGFFDFGFHCVLFCEGKGTKATQKTKLHTCYTDFHTLKLSKFLKTF